jgi:membrane protease YdiL (CAAX protease family)
MTRSVRPVGARNARPASPVQDPSDLRPLLIFVAVALPIGWILLAIPVANDLPQEPFVLGAVLLALVFPTVLLTVRESGWAGVQSLLRDVVRPPRPWWWGIAAAFALPAVVWIAAAAQGGAEPLTVTLIVLFLLDLAVGAIVVNLWEEMAWTGFVQRRSMARWGAIGGSVITAALFALIHLPLAFDEADDAGDVAVGVAILITVGIGLRLIIAGLDSWSGRSLLAVGVLHASFNATSGLIDEDYEWTRLVVTLLFGCLCAAFIRRRDDEERTTA